MDIEIYICEYVEIYVCVYRCVCVYVYIFSQLCARLLALPDELLNFFAFRITEMELYEQIF